MRTEKTPAPNMIYHDLRRILAQNALARQSELHRSRAAQAARRSRALHYRPAVFAIGMFVLAAGIASPVGTHRTMRTGTPGDLVTARIDRAVQVRTSAAMPVDTTAPDSANEEAAQPHPFFMLRVGTFRNESNAERLAASLREEGSLVQMEILEGGFKAVTLGPFNLKSTAEDTAREVQQRSGLTPQILTKGQSQ